MNGMVRMAARVAEIEQSLQALDSALAGEAFDVIEQASRALQRSLGDALNCLAHSGQTPVLDADLRHRLGLARERAKRQQLAVQRTVQSLERTLGVLLPRQDAPATYGALAQSPAAMALMAYR